MEKDLISINGSLKKYSDLTASGGCLPGYDFIYQRIHTLEHVPLHIEAHTGILDISCERLYGTSPELSSAGLRDEIGQLLKNNRYPKGSNLVTLYILPPETEGMPATRLLVCEKQMLYKGYTLWHKSVKAIVTPYEYPFAEHKTAVSYAAHTFSLSYAQRSGADMALTSNQSGILTGAGENPLFAVSGNKILTTPLTGYGVAESVERRLGIESALAAGLEVFEEPLSVKELKNYDELFAAETQGITSIGHCRKKLYPNSMAKRISSHMNGITTLSRE